MTYTLGYVFVFLANLGSEDCDHHHCNDYQCIMVIVAKILAILPPATPLFFLACLASQFCHLCRHHYQLYHYDPPHALLHRQPHCQDYYHPHNPLFLISFWILFTLIHFLVQTSLSWSSPLPSPSSGSLSLSFLSVLSSFSHYNLEIMLTISSSSSLDNVLFFISSSSRYQRLKRTKSPRDNVDDIIIIITIPISTIISTLRHRPHHHRHLEKSS